MESPASSRPDASTAQHSRAGTWQARSRASQTASTSNSTLIQGKRKRPPKSWNCHHLYIHQPFFFFSSSSSTALDPWIFPAFKIRPTFSFSTSHGVLVHISRSHSLSILSLLASPISAFSAVPYLTWLLLGGRFVPDTAFWA